MDFKQLCYEHVVYRLKGETWAYAFTHFGDRAYNSGCCCKYNYLRDAICCPFTGRIAIRLIGGCVVLLTNIDFSLNEVTVLDFTAITMTIMDVKLINRGNELLVKTHALGFALIYDIGTMEVKYKIFSDAFHQCYAIKTDCVVDYFTRKQFQIKVEDTFVDIYYVNSYDHCERHDVCDWRHNMFVYLISENGSVVITSKSNNDAGCQIYCLKRRAFVLNELNDEKWFLFNSNTLFRPANTSFLVYNKKIKNWKEIKPNLSLRKEQRCECHLTADFVPMPSYKIMESFPNDIAKHALIRFKQGGPQTKTFDREVEIISENHYHLLRHKDEKHPISEYRRMEWPMSNEKSQEFAKWYEQVYMAEPNIKLINVKKALDCEHI
ncbi:unnamed protein product [Bursaphelenchus okinawaensis]|uniref:Uncharacterized protein n=1 Tax=Bursaphelenchus okinawaensis TaxID=465554 RepID=A0A811KAY9_9BILA|nr:unnamed protein product [Bursaphelenchus okinawaensis]CAG9095879.1 unnamed protein product [Bursaphelenchus okinawaensis]